MTMRAGLLTAALVLAATSASAQRSWSDLSPGERERAWRNYQRFEALPEDRRQHLEDRYQRFREMPQNEQQRMRRNYDAYRELPPDQRQQFHRKYERWRERQK